MVDLEIKVSSGVLNGRYSPIVRENDDTAYGNMAIEFKPGALFKIDDAIIVHGNTVDPNDPNGDRWAWIDGRNLGLSYDFFISLSRQTAEKVEITEHKSVEFSKIEPNGNVYYKGPDNQDILVPQTIQPITSPQPINPIT